MAEQTIQSADAGLVVESPRNPTELPSMLKDIRTPNVRQISLMVAAAVVAALVVVGMLWLNEGAYKSVFPGMSDRDAADVMAALDQANIPYRIHTRTGAVEVQEDQASRVRLMLAGRGLPKGAPGVGPVPETGVTEGLGGGSREETRARMKRDQERGLEHSIATLGSVQSARVHLAMGAHSVFVREREEPSASVVLTLFPGRVLSSGQVAAIAHLVSSSVPRLAIDKISIIDQRGRLLNRNDGQDSMGDGSAQLAFKRQIEERARTDIENILASVVGAGNVRANVTADIDFTRTEQTKEQYLPQESVVRSHKRREEITLGGEGQKIAAGLVGAVANQPAAAAAAKAEEDTIIDINGDGIPDAGRRVLDEVVNSEVSKVISSIRSMPGQIRRLSVAVVIRDGITAQEAPAADGETAVQAADQAQPNPAVPAEAEQAEPAPVSKLTPERIAEITQLIKDGIGFDAARGDSVTVMTTDFQDQMDLELETPWWENGAYQNWAKLGLGALGALLVLLMVVRPLVKSATLPPPGFPQLPGPQGAGHAGAPVTGQLIDGTDESLSGAQLDGDMVRLGGGPGRDALDNLSASDDTHYESLVLSAQNLAEKDPKRVALAIERWLNEYE
jgi:flagellar M-ring protein FliF